MLTFKRFQLLIASLFLTFLTVDSAESIHPNNEKRASACLKIPLSKALSSNPRAPLSASNLEKDSTYLTFDAVSMGRGERNFQLNYVCDVQNYPAILNGQKVQKTVAINKTWYYKSAKPVVFVEEYANGTTIASKDIADSSLYEPFDDEILLSVLKKFKSCEKVMPYFVLPHWRVCVP